MPPNIAALEWDSDPVDVAARWPVDQPLLWLHSGRLHQRWARWSIMATSRAVFRFAEGRSRLDGELNDALAGVALTHDPLRDLDAILAATSLDPRALPPSDSPPPFCGGWIGYLSYDLGRMIEPRAQHHEHSSSEGWPLIELAWCPDALVFDHERENWFSIGDDAHERVATHNTSRVEFALGDIKSEIEPRQYEAMVARTIEYIAAGDIFQANIAQRFRASFDGSTRALAIAAFAQAQPWYGAYLELDLNSAQADTDLALKCQGRDPGERARLSRALLSLSPELFLHSTPLTRRIMTRPIKGTRPASSRVNELRDSVKDQAELNMIIDLMRNDLGRVCEFGGVTVPQARIIETHPTVHHGVAEIAGRLRENTSAGDILRATFPPGSVTGAPKIRAMQVIDELESPPARGPYCGAIGFISDCGAMTLNVAIRTLLIEGTRENDRCDLLRDGEISYSAGAGIVADSVPAREQQETRDKVAVLRAIEDSASVDPGRREACHETVTIETRSAQGTPRSASA